MFQTDLLSIISSLNNVFTAIFVILVTLPSASEVILTSLADGSITSMTNIAVNTLLRLLMMESKSV
jgi:hypothetical protein